MVLHTPLYDWHVAAGARFVEFGGWEMPLVYSGIVEEHLTVRRAVGLFDVSHMGKLLVAGPSAHVFLDRLSANDISTQRGRARYTHLLRDDGTIIDDVIVTCLTPSRYFVVCNAGPRPAVLAWFEAHRPADVGIQDLTATHLCFALQGPHAPELLQRFTSFDVPALKPFWGARAEVDLPSTGDTRTRIPVEAEGWGSPTPDALMAAPSEVSGTTVSGGPEFLLTRTGYTGEPGFELFPPERPGRRLWSALISEGADLGIRPIGLGARDTLRLEKGYLLSGQDFDGRQTPLEVNSAWVVKWGRPFIGHEALERQRDRDDYPRLVGLRMEDKGIPRHGCNVLADSTAVGAVTSGTMSPSLRVGVALASVDHTHTSLGDQLLVDIRGTPHAARTVQLPFL